MRTAIARFVAACCFVSAAHAAAPTPTSAAAAIATATQNRLCTGITPFYWEIGDATGTLVSGSEGVDGQGAAVTPGTMMNVSSSSKWLYGIYVAQIRGSLANLTPTDVNFLHMTSGYTNIGGDQNPAGTCPNADNPNTINVCLQQLNPVNHLPYSYQDPATVGIFDYDGGHMQNHAGLYSPLGDIANTALGAAVSRKLGDGVKFIYTQPLIPGAVYTNPGQYALVLKHIVDGTLVMRDVLGTFPVCTKTSATCNSLNSPIPEAWHYSIAHWVEDDPSTHGDGAFSGPGGQGFYPWVEASKQYYGMVARVATGPQRQGFQSVQCGRLIRRAWDTGIQQMGRLPSL